MRETHDAPLAEHTTMRVGGPAQRLVVAETIDEIVDTVREVDDADEPLLVLDDLYDKCDVVRGGVHGDACAAELRRRSIYSSALAARFEGVAVDVAEHSVC